MSNKISDIVNEVADRVAGVLGIDVKRVFFDPRSSELPETGDYLAIRHTLEGGTNSTPAYDTFLMTIDIAADVADPAFTGTPSAVRREARGDLIEAVRDQLTPGPLGTVTTPISELELPVVTEALTSPIDDEPERLLIGLVLVGFVTLGRGGYEG